MNFLPKFQSCQPVDIKSYVRNQLKHNREKRWNLQDFQGTFGLCVLERPINMEVYYGRGLTCISIR
jgi:hypothetical protein